MTQNQGWLLIALGLTITILLGYIAWKLNQPAHPWTDDLRFMAG